MVIKNIYMAGTLAVIALATGCSKSPTVSFAAYSTESCHPDHVKVAPQTTAKLPPIGA